MIFNNIIPLRVHKSLGRRVFQYLLNMFLMIWIRIPLNTIPQVILQLVLQGHFCRFPWFSLTRLAGSPKNFASLASFALLGHCNSCWISACTMARTSSPQKRGKSTNGPCRCSFSPGYKWIWHPHIDVISYMILPYSTLSYSTSTIMYMNMTMLIRNHSPWKFRALPGLYATIHFWHMPRWGMGPQRPKSVNICDILWPLFKILPRIHAVRQTKSGSQLS